MDERSNRVLTAAGQRLTAIREGGLYMADRRSWIQVAVVVVAVALASIAVFSARSKAADEAGRPPQGMPGGMPGMQGMPGMPGMMPGGMPGMVPGMMPGMMPMMGAPAQMTASGSYVYVLRGDTLYQYSTTGLKLVSQATLPAPKPPHGMPPGGGMMPGMQGPPSDQ